MCKSRPCRPFKAYPTGHLPTYKVHRFLSPSLLEKKLRSSERLTLSDTFELCIHDWEYDSGPDLTKPYTSFLDCLLEISTDIDS